MVNGLDPLSRRILDELMRNPRASEEDLAHLTQASLEVVRSRLAKLGQSGVLAEYAVRLDPYSLGFPYEAVVQGVPTANTTRLALRRLAKTRCVTRVMTLASHRSVLFSLCGQEPDQVVQEALRLAEAIGLADLEVAMVLDDIHDDRSRTFFRSTAMDDDPDALLQADAVTTDP